MAERVLAGDNCEGVAIRYEHLPGLGVASDERQRLHTQADYDALFAAYERDSLPRQTEALARTFGRQFTPQHL